MRARAASRASNSGEKLIRVAAQIGASDPLQVFMSSLLVITMNCLSNEHAGHPLTARSATWQFLTFLELSSPA